MRPFSRLSLHPLVPTLFAALSVTFVVFVCLAQVIPLENEPTANVYNDTVRLRVVACSDSPADQTLKIKVRDAVVPLLAPLVEECKSAEEALLALRTYSFSIEQTAAAVLRENGSKDPVRLTLVREYAPIRRYGTFTFPAGDYATLRIDIGRAKGHNWWCVLYPPLCTDICRADGSEFVTDLEKLRACGFSDAQIDALADGSYDRPTARFALIDAFRRLFA